MCQRVSLKAALAAQGFIGQSRQETEWSKWVLSEKEELSRVMERHGIEWEKLGTKDEHLSVLNYKKEQRAKEVATLEERHDEIEKRLTVLEKKEDQIGLNVRRYNEDPEWQLPEPSVGMTTKAYKAKIVVPLVDKLKKVICGLVARYLDLQSSIQKIKSQIYKAHDKAEGLLDRLVEETNENKQLREIACDFRTVKEAVGQDRVY